jgi:hypothetical protein
MAIHFQDKIIFPLMRSIDYGIKLKYIYPDWKHINEGIDVSQYDNFGILTGSKNQITILQVHNGKLDMLGFDEVNTLQILTPDGYLCYVFDYEPRLDTIYKLTPRVSVFNNNSFIIAGLKYSISANKIVKMPSPVLDFLLQKQQQQHTSVLTKYVDLITLLPESWFSELDNIARLIFSFRNSDHETPICIRTVNQILSKCSIYYYNPDIEHLFRVPMTYKQKTLTLFGFQKLVSERNPTEFRFWKIKYDKRKVRRLVFKKDHMILMNDAKLIFPAQKLKSEYLNRVDSRIHIVKKSVCKSCLELFRSHCCNEYARTNKTARLFIMNAEIV